MKVRRKEKKSISLDKWERYVRIFLPAMLSLLVAVPFFILSYYAITYHGLGFSLLVAGSVYLVSFLAGYQNMKNPRP